MEMQELKKWYGKIKYGEDNFYKLMQNRVREILLVATFYDAFIFEQDGRLSEQIYREYKQLQLSTAPRITSVPTGKQALELLGQRPFDLVITMMRTGDVGPFELSEEARKLHPDLPILLLLNVQSDIVIIERNPQRMKHIDDVFLWNGDTSIFLAMIKSVEDKLNIEHDTRQGSHPRDPAGGRFDPLLLALPAALVQTDSAADGQAHRAGAERYRQASADARATQK